MAIKKEYNEDSIKTISDFDHMRTRPSGYIPDTAELGQMYLLKEIIDNSIDELDLIKNNGVLEVFIFKSQTRSTYQVAVLDNGRGIPIGKLIESFSSAKCSGKFDTDSYQFSTGTFGIGSTVVVALSSWFRAITLNKAIIGDTTIHHTSIPKEISTTTNHTGTTGMVVMFEPDGTIFSQVSDFMADYSKLTEYLTQLGLFASYSARLTIIDNEIPTEVRNGSTLQVMDYINECRMTPPVYDSLRLDKNAYINSFFEITKPWTNKYSFNYAKEDGTLYADLNMLVLTKSNINNNTKLTFVNNILFTNSNSLHISMLYQHAKDKLVQLIPDNNIKEFFKTKYRLPIWLVIDIKYAGAQFAGMAKLSFSDTSFKKPYKAVLNKFFTDELVKDLYGVIEGHIISNYNKFSNKNLKVTDMRHLLTQLNNPTKFNDCSTSDRDKAELLLAEGDSACSDADRDSEFQATYTLGGKPFNGLTTLSKLSEASNNIKANKIFQDIIRITNITPGSNDLDKLNFGKILIMADADTHGYHITNIVIGNLYALCPALIEEGHVHVVVPPLYCLNVKGHKETMYVRNTTELNAALAHQVYYRCFDITIESNQYRKILTRAEFMAFAEIVNKIGNVVKMLSVEYFIPAAILEQLSLMTGHLNLRNPNIAEIKKWLGYDAKYVSSSNILILSVGNDDIIVPLTSVTDLIYKRILPLYREFYYGKTRIYVTTKLTDAMKDRPISIVQLFEMFGTLQSLFKVRRNKGLGSMDENDRKYSCVNPATRRTYQITSIGDLNKIFNCLGSDPKYRKQVVDGS